METAMLEQQQAEAQEQRQAEAREELEAWLTRVFEAREQWKADLREHLAEAREQWESFRKALAEAREQLAEAREQLAEAREQLAEAREQREHDKMNPQLDEEDFTRCNRCGDHIESSHFAEHEEACEEWHTSQFARAAARKKYEAAKRNA